MAQFELLPIEIQNTVNTHLFADEEIKMCFLAGASAFLGPDYVIITSKRIIIVNIRNVGSLNQSYVNVRCDVPIMNITKIDTTRSFKNKLFRQTNIGIQINGYKHLINDVNSREAKQAVELLSSMIAFKRGERVKKR